MDKLDHARCDIGILLCPLKWCDVVGLIIPKRGLCQCNHLSPYLHIICSQGLSSFIKRVETICHIHGSWVCRGTPLMSHLFFANDSFLFFRATKSEITKVLVILSSYEAYLGWIMNLTKSKVAFSGNVFQHTYTSLAQMLDVSQQLRVDSYIGLPSIICRSKKSVFSIIKNRVWRSILDFQVTFKIQQRSPYQSCGSNNLFALYECFYNSTTLIRWNRKKYDELILVGTKRNGRRYYFAMMGENANS